MHTSIFLKQQEVISHNVILDEGIKKNMTKHLWNVQSRGRSKNIKFPLQSAFSVLKSFPRCLSHKETTMANNERRRENLKME